MQSHSLAAPGPAHRARAAPAARTSGRGRARCTRLRVARPPEGASSSEPWALVDYYTKKRERATDALGNLLHGERIAEPAAWTRDAQLQLAIQVVCRELSGGSDALSEEQLVANVVRLQALLPDLKPGGPGARIADVARLACRLDNAAAALMALREELPDVNVSRLAAAQLQLLAEPPERVREGVREAKRLLSGCGPAGMRQLLVEHPQLLRPGYAAALLDEVARLFGLTGRDEAAAFLGPNPGLAAAVDCLRGQSRGDRDPEYQWGTSVGGGDATRTSG